MTARDHYSISLTCPACGYAGKADMSEDDGPWIRSLDRRTERLDPGIRQGVDKLRPLKGRLSGQVVSPTFICRCGAELET